jgi:hypothetical protein
MNAKERQQLVAAETEAFLDSNFGQLDLSGSPNLQALPKDGFDTDKHGLNRIVESGSNQLRNFANNLDAESLQRLADETGDPDIADHLQDEIEHPIAEKFVRTHPTYFKCDENYDAIRNWLDERSLGFTADNLDTAFKALCRAGEMKMRPGTPKQLANHELLAVISDCKEGRLEDAVSRYLDYALPDAQRLWSDTQDFLMDEGTLGVRNAACRFVFINASNAQDSPSFRAFEKRYFHGRSPVRTVNDYALCHEDFLKSEQAAERERIVSGSEPVSRGDLDALTDDQVDRLTHSSLQVRAKELRRTRG